MTDRLAATLPDRPCRPGGVLLVGINPAPPSVTAGHYYQGRLGQRLWNRLRWLGLLNDEIGGWEDDAFVSAGNGLTDLVKRPTKAAAELTAQELAFGRTTLADKVRAWRPGLLLFAFRPPAEALLSDGVLVGRCKDFEGVPSFLLTSPYARGRDTATNTAELLALLGGDAGENPPSGATPRAPFRASVTALKGARELVAGPTQRITAADLAAGRIRLPTRRSSGAKAAFPVDVTRVRIVLRGESMEVRYDPRLGPDRERSGVLTVGSTRLARLVREDEVLQVRSEENGTPSLD